MASVKPAGASIASVKAADGIGASARFQPVTGPALARNELSSSAAVLPRPSPRTVGNCPAPSPRVITKAATITSQTPMVQGPPVVGSYGSSIQAMPAGVQSAAVPAGTWQAPATTQAPRLRAEYRRSQSQMPARLVSRVDRPSVPAPTPWVSQAGLLAGPRSAGAPPARRPHAPPPQRPQPRAAVRPSPPSAFASRGYPRSITPGPGMMARAPHPAPCPRLCSGPPAGPPIRPAPGPYRAPPMPVLGPAPLGPRPLRPMMMPGWAMAPFPGGPCSFHQPPSPWGPVNQPRHQFDVEDAWSDQGEDPIIEFAESLMEQRREREQYWRATMQNPM